MKSDWDNWKVQLHRHVGWRVSLGLLFAVSLTTLPPKPALAVPLTMQGEWRLPARETHLALYTPASHTYEVKPGDTLYRIAARYQISLDKLMTLNGIDQPRTLAVGTRLTIPAGGWREKKPAASASYVVQPGDTLSRIAKSHGVSLTDLIARNGLANPNLLRVGQELRLPDAGVHLASIPGTERPNLIASRSEARMGEELGEFTLTAYTAGPESTGKSPGHPGYGITASGLPVEEGVTIAVDPAVIPLGSRVYIEGIGYRVAQDKGSAIKGNRIDVYMSDLSDAVAFGVKKEVTVRLIETP